MTASAEAGKLGLQLPRLPGLKTLATQAYEAGNNLSATARHAVDSLCTAGSVIASETQKYVTPPTPKPLSLNSLPVWETLASPESDRKVTVMVGGGAMAGVFSAGALTELGDTAVNGHTLVDNVATYVAASVGAINTVYFLGAKEPREPEVRYQDFAKGGLIRPGIRPGMLNLEYLKERLAEEIVPGKIRDEVEAEVLVAVTNNKGETELHAIRNLTDSQTTDLLLASAAAPYAYTQPTYVNGDRMGDGFLNGFAIKERIAAGDDEFLVLSNFPTDATSSTAIKGIPPPVERLAMRAYLRASGYPEDLRRAAINIDINTHNSLKLLETDGISAAVIEPSEQVVSLLSTDTEALKLGAQQGRAEVVYQISRHFQPIAA